MPEASIDESGRVSLSRRSGLVADMRVVVVGSPISRGVIDVNDEIDERGEAVMFGPALR